MVSNSKNKNSSDIIYKILDVCSLYSLKVEIILYKKYDFKSEMMYSIYNPWQIRYILIIFMMYYNKSFLKNIILNKTWIICN